MTEYNKLSSFPKHLQVPSTICTSEFRPWLAHKTAKKFFPIDIGRALETFESLPKVRVVPKLFLIRAAVMLKSYENCCS